jgi:hypothetical protein
MGVYWCCKAAQRCLLRRVAGHHFVGQRKSCRRHDQSDHHLLAVRPLVAAVAVSGFGILFGFAFDVCAGQVVQQQIEFRIRPETVGPAAGKRQELRPAIRRLGGGLGSGPAGPHVGPTV